MQDSKFKGFTSRKWKKCYTNKNFNSNLNPVVNTNYNCSTDYFLQGPHREVDEKKMKK